jgi:hypothetical protein
VPDPLAFKALSYGAVGLLALTVLILSVVWLRIEIISGKPLSGFLPVLLIIAVLCALISLLTAYVQFQQATSTMLHWGTGLWAFCSGRLPLKLRIPENAK